MRMKALGGQNSRPLRSWGQNVEGQEKAGEPVEPALQGQKMRSVHQAPGPGGCGIRASQSLRHVPLAPFSFT